MKNFILLLLLALFSTLAAQDSLYCSLKFMPFKEFNGNVKAGGDLNGDGYNDLVISRHAHPNFPGKVNVYFGKAIMDGLATEKCTIF